MKLLSLLVIVSCGLSAQQTVATGIIVRPNAAGTAGGYINIYNAAATAAAQIRIQGGASAIEINGMPSSNGNIIFNPGNVSTKSSVHVISPSGNTSDPSLILWAGGTGTSSNGLQLKLSNGSTLFNLDFSDSGNPTYSALSGTSHKFSAASGLIAAVTIVNSTGTVGLSSESIYPTVGSTYDNGNTSSRWLNTASVNSDFTNLTVSGLGTGALKVASGVVSLVTGTSSNCVHVDGSSAACPGGGGTAPFIDTTAILYSVATPANTLTASLAGLTAARTWTLPDYDMVPAATNHTQTFSANQTLAADLLADANTRKLGDSTPFYQVMANRFEGACSGCTSAVNYMSTRKFQLYDYSGFNAFWYFQAIASPGAGELDIIDNAGVTQAVITQSAISLNLKTTITGTSSGSLYSATVRDTGASPGINFYSGTTTKRGSLSSGATAAFSFQDGSDTHIFTGFQATGNVQVGSTSDQGFKFYVNGTTKSAGNVTIAPQAGFGQRAAIFDNNGVVQVGSTDFIPNTRTISTTSPLGGGGDLSANRTLTCTTCVTGVSGTSPISSSGGTTPAISCSTCVTTAGGQSISGTTTLSTLSVSTAATINSLLTVNGGNVDIDSGQTYSVNGSFFGQDYTGGINVGTSTLFFKSGILYACTGTC